MKTLFLGLLALPLVAVAGGRTAAPACDHPADSTEPYLSVAEAIQFAGAGQIVTIGVPAAALADVEKAETALCGAVRTFPDTPSRQGCGEVRQAALARPDVGVAVAIRPGWCVDVAPTRPTDSEPVAFAR